MARRGGLIGPDGTIAWMCAPRWDSPAVFAQLLGGAGRYSVTPADPWYVWGGYYEGGSLIWRSKWTGDSVTECREALTLPADPYRCVILRRIEALTMHGFGDEVAAGRWFERNRAACGPAGLFTEEYDVHQRQLRGNLPQAFVHLPQAFVHAALLECAATLTADRDPDEAGQG